MVVSVGSVLGTEDHSITAAVSLVACAPTPLPGMGYVVLPGAINLAAYPERQARIPFPRRIWVHLASSSISLSSILC